MSTKHSFAGNIITIPNVYSDIKSGVRNPEAATPFGNLLIIDTGSGANWGGGAGVSGTLVKGKDAIYDFDNIEDFRNFVEGGTWWLLAKPLFRPSKSLQNKGVSKISYVSAKTTVPAEITFAPTGDNAGSDSGPANGGTVVLQLRNEGPVGNGVLNASLELQQGWAIKLTAGVNDINKFILKFYHGPYKGLDQNSLPFDGIDALNVKAELKIQSKEFSTMTELYDWMSKDFVFNSYFKVKSSTTSGNAEVDAYDLVTYTDYTLAIGGTESYSTDDLIALLENFKDLNIDFVFADNWGAEAFSANNQMIFDWVINQTRFKPQMYVAGYSLKDDFANSKVYCSQYDNDYVSVVHGGIKIASRTIGTGFREYDSYYKAAVLLGREAGMAPQVPLTFKDIDIDGELHSLSDKEVIQGLDAGLLMTRNVDGSFDCVKGINTLQDNTYPLNDNGTTHQKQLRRIARQINKEIIIIAKRDLLKNPVGVNRNTLSPNDVQKWLESFLQKRIATPQSDNLILSYRDITVSREADAYKINYSFVANSEIAFLFFTGLIVDIN